jgi:hypothetical protein
MSYMTVHLRVIYITSFDYFEYLHLGRLSHLVIHVEYEVTAKRKVEMSRIW